MRCGAGVVLPTRQGCARFSGVWLFQRGGEEGLLTLTVKLTETLIFPTLDDHTKTRHNKKRGQPHERLDSHILGTPARSHSSRKSATIGTVPTPKGRIFELNPHIFVLAGVPTHTSHTIPGGSMLVGQ
eukprot:jgi/Botrbrau1/23486/Bobra.106_1s0037.1